MGTSNYLWEVGRNHCSIGKLAPSKGPQSLRGGLDRVKFDKDLADTCDLPAATGGARHLDVEHCAKLGALVADVLANL